jgi:hypothetical protein
VWFCDLGNEHLGFLKPGNFLSGCLIISFSRNTLRPWLGWLVVSFASVSVQRTGIQFCSSELSKFVWCWKRHLKLSGIRRKITELFKEWATVWPEVVEVLLKDTLSRARRSLGTSRGHKLTLGTNTCDIRRRRRLAPRNYDASGGLKLQLRFFWRAYTAGFGRITMKTYVQVK